MITRPAHTTNLTTGRARSALAASIAVLLASLAATAHAEPPAATRDDDDTYDVDRPLSNPPAQPSDEARQVAARLYNEATDSARKGRAKEAFALYRAAYEQDGSPEALANLAVIEGKLGRPRAAAEHLARMIEKLPAEYAHKADDLKRRLAEQAALVATIRFEIGADGEVYADGKWVGAGPFTRTLYVDPGEHVVRLQTRGVTIQRTYVLDKGELGVTNIQTAEVDAEVAKLPRPAPPPPAPAPPSTALVATGASLAVAFSALGAIGVGVAVRAAGERTTIDDGVRSFGGACPASSPGFADDCHARDQEAGNERIGQILAGTGFAAGALAGLGTLLYVSVPSLRDTAATARLQVLPGPGGITVRGTF